LITPHEFEVLKKRLKAGETLRFPIVSDSMSPAIKVGDFIEVIDLQRSPEPFDILVFLEEDKLICHIFVKAGSRFESTTAKYLFRSLKYPYLDRPVSPELVLGLVQNFKLSGWQKLKFWWNFFRS